MLGTLSAPHHFVLRRARDDPYECRQTLVYPSFLALRMSFFENRAIFGIVSGAAREGE